MIEYPKYKKVLFCTDFSENSDCAFDYAFGIAKRDEAVLYILHIKSVIPRWTYVDNYMTKEDWDKLKVTMREDIDKKYNDQYLSQIKDKNKVKTVTKSGREDEEILKFVRKENIDIIVIGTHGRTGIEHVLLGSVAEKIVRRSPIPVFIIPCKKKSGRDKSK
ncbi:MAG: universal stress protein [Proteobacteria bacterium]|nr:universal stress protein [Pseudomonadota bacterium]MBU4581511.1 universal stress protein [Pseudomonadota bacterium]MCG2741680.1 universal stress protein [Syntrophaceae bacterium]